jgi:hypothetical protein
MKTEMLPERLMNRTFTSHSGCAVHYLHRLCSLAATNGGFQHASSAYRQRFGRMQAAATIRHSALRPCGRQRSRSPSTFFERDAMKTMLASLSALVAVVWGWDVLNTSFPANAHPLWIARQEALYLSGLLSIALMSLAMLLATRPHLAGIFPGGHGPRLPDAQVGRHSRHLLCRAALADRTGGATSSSRASVAKAACPRKNSPACWKSCVIFRRTWASGQSTPCWRCW